MKDWLEQGLHDKFQGQTPAFDIDQAWERLDRERRRRKRRPVFFWWSSGSLLAAVVIAWLIIPRGPAITPPAIQSVDPKQTEQLQAVSTTFTPIVPTAIASTPKRRQIPITVASTSTTPSVAESHQAGSRVIELEAAAKIAAAVSSPDEKLTALPQVPTLTPAALECSPLSPAPRPAFELSIARPKWSITAEGSYGLLLGTGIQDDVQQLDPVDYWQSGLQLKRRFGSFYVYSGLDYIQLHHRMNINHTVTSFEWRDEQLVQIIQYPDGTVEEIRDEGLVAVTDILEAEAWQQYRFLSIPLGFGYQIGADNVYLGFEAGGLVSIWAAHKGWAAQEGLFQLKELQDMTYTKAGLAQWRSQVYFGHIIRKHWHLQYFAQAGGFLSPIFPAATDWKAKTSYLGLGIRSELRF